MSNANSSARYEMMCFKFQKANGYHACAVRRLLSREGCVSIGGVKWVSMLERWFAIKRRRNADVLQRKVIVPSIRNAAQMTLTSRTSCRDLVVKLII